MTRPGTNLFIETLENLDGGDTVAELHHELKNLVGHVRSTSKGGSITVVLKVKPGKGPTIILEDDYKVRYPKVDRATSIFYADDNNNLSRNDPRQPKLFEPKDDRPADGAPPVMVETVDPVTGEIIE